MDDKFTEILEGVTDKWHRSCLEPYADLIEELRRRGIPYRKIARILAARFQLAVAWTTIIRFVHLRSKAKKAQRNEELLKRDSAPQVCSTPSAIVVKETPVPKPSPSDNEIQRRIDALKARPSQQPDYEVVFHYDPDEPLRIPPKTQKD